MPAWPASSPRSPAATGDDRLDVIETLVAARQVDALGKIDRRRYDAFVWQLSRQGCLALGYRLTGPEPIERLCVKHLRGALRVVVAFAVDGQPWVLLVGSHDAEDRARDVYRTVYRLAVEELVDQVRRLRRPRR